MSADSWRCRLGVGSAQSRHSSFTRRQGRRCCKSVGLRLAARDPPRATRGEGSRTFPRCSRICRKIGGRPCRRGRTPSAPPKCEKARKKAKADPFFLKNLADVCLGASRHRQEFVPGGMGGKDLEFQRRIKPDDPRIEREHVCTQSCVIGVGKNIGDRRLVEQVFDIELHGESTIGSR